MPREYRDLNTTEIRTIPASEVRFVPGANGKPPHVEGYAAVFNSPSEDLGGFVEYVMPGAFTRSLAENADVRLLINHEGMPLARTTSGTLTLREDDKGLFFSADLDPDDPDVRALAPKMARGDLNQCSFAFATNADNWRSDNGQTIRELKDVSLSDVSVVTYPAYPATSVAMRSLVKHRVKAKVSGTGDGVPIPVIAPEARKAAAKAIAKTQATAKAGESRTVVEYQDSSFVYYSRWAVQSCREAFDSLNNVLDMLAGIEDGSMDDRDMEAAEDLVSTLVDLIAKGRRTKATLEALGAEDETEDDTDDDTPQKQPAAQASSSAPSETASLETDVQQDGEQDDPDDGEETNSARAADPMARARAMLALAEVE